MVHIMSYIIMIKHNIFIRLFLVLKLHKIRTTTLKQETHDCISETHKRAQNVTHQLLLIQPRPIL